MGIQSKLRALLKSGFVRSTGVLVGGTAMAQALTVLALPVLTRLYSPEDFSVLAVYIAILTMISVIACLRLEIAIPLPESEEVAANLLALALTFAAVFAGLFALVLFGFGARFFGAIGKPELSPYGWLLPVGVWLAASYAALQYWSTREKQFELVAKTRVAQATVGLSAQLGLGWWGAGPVGLLLGHALLAGSGILALVRRNIGVFRLVSLRHMKSAFGEYRRFPIYSTLEALTNNAGMQVPVLLIAAYAIGPEAGFLLLATRALGTPVNLIGGAISQVYLSRAPEEMRAGRLASFTVKILFKLAHLTIVPLVLLALIAPWAFAFVFGEEWRRAGELIVWMTPWFVLKLLSSPVSMVMHVKMQQRAMLFITIYGLVLRVAVVLAVALSYTPAMAEAYALASAGFYLSLLLMVGRVAGLSQLEISKLVLYSVLSVLPILALVWGVIT
jgi:O-antigen/teichoic acid export membrane protein